MKIIQFLIVSFIGMNSYGQQLTESIAVDTLENAVLITPSPETIAKGHFSEFLVPGNNGFIISRFGPRGGRMHNGTDIRMQRGDTIVAVEDGHIIRSSWGTGFGNIIIVKHLDDVETYYGHLSKFIKKKGEKVKRGEAIALAGSTGNAKGPHLHFEIRESGIAFDPELVYDFKNGKIRDEAQHEKSLLVVHKKLRPKGYGNKIAVPEFYTVRSGDSLWKISRRYNMTISTICSLNHISAKKILKIGQPLRLY